MKKILKYKTIAAGLGGICLATLAYMAYVHFSPKIVDAAKNVVAYDNGEAEIIIRDQYEFPDYRFYRANVPALFYDGVYHVPNIEYIGSNGERIVYAYTADNTGCTRGIFYIDRIEKKSRTMLAESCIDHQLDIHDSTYYLGLNQDEYGTVYLAVGSLLTGKEVASTSVTAGYYVPFYTHVDGGRGSILGITDWEMSTLIYSERRKPSEFTDERLQSCDEYRIFALDIATSKRTDITPESYESCKTEAPVLTYVRQYGQTKEQGQFMIIKTAFDGSNYEQYIAERIPLQVPDEW